MKKITGFLLAISLFLMSCGDDSKSPAEPAPLSSSEEEMSSSEESSSSIVPESSSEESSSSVESSSSWEEKHLAWDYLNPDIEYKEFTDPRDGHVYKYMEYSIYRFMAENLNYSDSIANTKLKRHSWCVNNSLDSCSKYGRYYTWSVAMNLEPYVYDEEVSKVPGNDYFVEYQGLCPEGWLMFANKSVWQRGLYVSNGLQLCARKGWKTEHCTDDFGFSALPGGYYEDGEFKELGESFHYWSVQYQQSATDGGMGGLLLEDGYDIPYAWWGIVFLKKKTDAAPVRCYQVIPKEERSSSSAVVESSSSTGNGTGNVDNYDDLVVPLPVD